MKLATLLSGGKDSVYSIYIAQSKGWNVVSTLTMAPLNSESWMFHYPNPEIAKAQSRLMGIPNTTVEIPGKKEEEIEKLREPLKELKESKEIQGIISGAIESEYQKSRLDYIGEDLELRTFSPLWRKNPYKLMKEQIESSFRYIITQVSSGGLDKTWLGREIDMDTLEELKKLKQEIGLHVAGEGGEYEVSVLEAPIFNGKIVIEDAEKKMESRNRGVYDIKSFKIEE